MKTFLAALIFIALCVVGLGFRIFFLKGTFPNTEIESNPEMRKLGIKCAKQEELELWKKNGGKRPEGCDGKYSEACESCGLYGTHFPTKK